MKTVNSVSGGQTSAYLMKHYPADYNVFALVRIQDPNCAPKDPWIKKYVESKIDEEFIGTLEDDTIFYTLYDLEQFTGQEIHWVKNESFDELIAKRKILPNLHRRYCTQFMKVKPIATWVYENIGEIVEMRLGFRANETRRSKKAIASHNENGYREEKIIVGKSPKGRNKWKTIEYAVNTFPLIDDNILKDEIVNYWQDKPVRFAQHNNCIGCFHRNPVFLKLQSEKFPNKFEWMVQQEIQSMNNISKSGRKYDFSRWVKGTTYDAIRGHKTQLSIEDLDGFNDCDSGYCGL